MPAFIDSDIVLGIIRFARDYPQIETSRLVLDAISSLEDLNSDMAPDCDLMYDYLKDYYEVEE